MRRVAALAAVAAACAVVAAGCGGGGGSAPARTTPVSAAGLFMTQILREEINGQWALQWRSLHPGHQRLISRSQYVACSQRMGTDFGTGDEIFRVLDVRDEAISVRGVPQHTSKLVTISFHHPGKQGLTYHMHAVRVGGRWTWILGGRFLSEVAHGRCLDGSPLRPNA
jgi:hypothetical protein